jgi:polysaccharide biosynthesis transport protein
MSFRQLFTVLRARWLSGFVAFFLVVGAAVGLSLLLPKQYTSTAQVLVDVKNPDPLTGMALAGMMMPSYMATQVDILQSGRVARKVIEAVGIGRSEELRAEWIDKTGGQGDFDGWVIDNLLSKSLDVKPSRESNAIRISYKSPDANFSAAMANAYAQAFLDVSLELRTEPARQFSAFFDGRAKQARDALETAQAKLSAYQKEKGLLANDERMDVETMRLNELSSQVLMLQTLAAEASGRAFAANANADRVADVLSHPVVAQLNMDVSRQQARLEEITSRLGDQNPQVIEARANLAELRRRLSAETIKVASSVGTTNTVSQARLSQSRAALEEQRLKVLRLKQQRDEAAVLLRDVESAQMAYQAVLQRQNQTSIESQSTQTNVSVMERAVPSSEHSSPKLVLNTLVAVFLGGLLALATALLRELLDRRLRSEEDVLQSLELPLLGVVPRATAKSLAKSSAASPLRHRMLAGIGRA